MKSNKQKFSFITALVVVLAFSLTLSTQAKTSSAGNDLNLKTSVKVNTFLKDGGKFYDLKCNGESTEAKSSKTKSGTVSEKKTESSGMKCGEGKCGDAKSTESKAAKSGSVSGKDAKTTTGGKCGEGKCGEGKTTQSKSGDTKKAKATEHKCGGEGEGGGKCGEGKCGTAKM